MEQLAGRLPWIILLFLMPVCLRAQPESLLEQADAYNGRYEYQQAARLYEAWLRQNQDKKDSLYIATLLKLSTAQRIQSKTKEAFANFILAQKTSDQLGLTDLSFKSRIELASFFVMTDKIAEARAMFSGIDPGKIRSPHVLCQYYHRKAYLFNQMLLLDSAFHFSQKALEVAEQHNITDAKGTIYNELANIFEKRADYQKAIEYYDLACGIYRHSNLRYYSNAYFNYARVFFNMKQYATARHHLLENLRCIDSTDWMTVKSPIYQYLSKVSFALNDSLSGYRYKALDFEELLKIQKAENDRQFEQLQVEYQVEQKNKELEAKNLVIGQKNSEQRMLLLIVILMCLVLVLAVAFFVSIRAKNKRLKKLLAENSFLAGESNHRIKNNLQLINSLVAWEIDKTKPHQIDTLVNIASKIESISVLHHRLYNDERLDIINLSEYLHDVYKGLLPFLEAHRIDVEIDLEPVSYKINSSVYLGLLLNELLVNSMKHAFNREQEKKIAVQLTKEDMHIRLRYSDNGRGMKPGSTPVLIDLLCRQLKGKYEVRSEQGFTFILNL